MTTLPIVAALAFAFVPLIALATYTTVHFFESYDERW